MPAMHPGQIHPQFPNSRVGEAEVRVGQQPDRQGDGDDPDEDVDSQGEDGGRQKYVEPPFRKGVYHGVPA